jgi:5'-nucleotidase
VSLIGRGDYDFEAAAAFTRRLADWVLAHGLPPDTLLNVNVPQRPEGASPRGVRVTRMGRRRYGDAIVEKTDPRGRKYYWIGGQELDFVEEEGTDFYATKDGYISVTPIHLDLTNYRSLDALQGVDGTWP